MTCPSFDFYLKYAHEFNGVEIDQDKERNMRYPVWDTVPADVHQLISDGNSDSLPGRDASTHVLAKIDRALARISDAKGKLDSRGTSIVAEFISNLIGDTKPEDKNIRNSIAIHEVMEAVKGEADKARNNDISIDGIAVEGILPALPLSRVAAVIGRKIMYADKMRFKSQENSPKIAAEIEQLYYTTGLTALQDLETQGYVNLHENHATLRDYTDAKSGNDKYASAVKVITTARSVSLNTAKLGITSNSQESAFFLDRSAADIQGKPLGVIVDSLSAIRHITQPSTITIPDLGKPDSKRVLADSDPQGNVQSPSTESARQKLYDRPLYVNTTVHKLLKLLSDDVNNSTGDGASAIKIIMKAFSDSPQAVQSLFGIKDSDNFSVDRKESLKGQNLSKTVPLDDTVEMYDIMTDDKGNPIGLHMAMKGGRNQRLYYDNSVLNAHASKQSRHMLTSGQQSVQVGTDGFHRLVYVMADTLGDKDITYTDIVNGGNANLDAAIEAFNAYDSSNKLTVKIAALSEIPVMFPGIDFASLLVTLSGVNDIRNLKESDTHLTTEFMDQADATAQGGTLTFQQALGTEANILTFMERIGIFKDADGNVITDPDQKLDDIYGLMSEGINRFLGKKGTGVVAIETKSGDVRAILSQTLDMLFGKNKKGERDLSKEATMPFIYGQGKAGATSSMTDSIAKRIVDSLTDPDTIKYLSVLLDDPSLTEDFYAPLNSTEGLYKKVKAALNAKGVPLQLYKIMETEIEKEFLSSFKQDSAAVYELAEQVENNHRMKVLPLGAVLDGIGIDEVGKYGMPLTKIVEVSSAVTGEDTDPLVKEGGHTVLTRKEKLFKSIMDVSVIHGVDSGLMYHAIDKVIGDTGAIVVHDQVVGSVELVAAVEAEYVKLNARLIAEYDTHQQVLNSIAFYSPKVAATPKFKALKVKVDARLAAKAKLVADGRLNDATDALIGDGHKYKDFAKDQNTKVPTPKQKVEVEGDQTPLLQSLASESPLIQRFLETSNNPAVVGDRNKFDTDNDQVVITGTDEGRGDGVKLTESDKKLQTEIIEHEIVHHNTAAYIAKAISESNTSASKDVAYFNKAIDKLGRLIKKDHLMSDEAVGRIRYILFSDSPSVQVAEFVAIMSSEPDTAAEVYKLLGGVPAKTLKSRIADFIAKVTSALLTDNDMWADVNTDKLQDALVRTLENGRSFKEEQRTEAIMHEKGFTSLHAGPSVDKSSLRYLNSAVAAMLHSKLEKNGKRLLGNIHANMKLRFPLYTDAVNGMKGIYDGSEAMQQLMHTITGEGTNKHNKANLQSESAKITSDHNSSIEHQRSEFKKALVGIDAATKKTIGRFVTELPLHEYFTHSSHIDTAAKLDAEVARVQAEVYSVNRIAVADVDDLIERNVQGKQGGSLYNLESKYLISKDDVHGANIRKLLALKSIQKIGSKEFETLLGNTELISLIKDNVMANKIALLDIKGTESLRDSLIPDYWKEAPQMNAVTVKDVKSYMNSEETGWKVLREPTKTTLGIVYKQLVDSTDLKGAFTDIKLKSADLDVYGSDHRGYSDVVKAGNDVYKLVLTPKEKEMMGLNDNFVESLVRGTAHSMAVKDSQSIRDAMLMDENRFVGTSDSELLGLVDILKSDNVDAPWFVKLDDNKVYSTLHKSIRAKYKQVGGRASDVEGASGSKFSDEVHLVRKDLSHILVGGHSSSFFKNKHMQWALRITKDVMAGTKIGMVVLNPLKIVKDMVSNVSYLSVSGASPKFIAKNFIDISRDYHKYQNLVHEVVQMKVRLASGSDTKIVKAKIDALQKQIDDNSVGDLANKGFINSLGSDLVAKSSEASSGLQSDMQTALEYILKNKKGNKNILGHFLQKLHEAGFQSEDYIKYIGGIVGRAKDGKAAEQHLNTAVARIKNIKREEDIVAYVSQYTTSPGSELVRLGSSTTDLVDVLAKETLYRHDMKNEGMTAEAARIHVLDSFPDYKENLPMAVKQLSDVGIIMFPSFWLRIQKTIYRIAKHKPVNMATELLLEEYVTGNVSTIFDANIINKYESFGGIVHTPLDSSGINSVFPTNLLNGL